MGVRTGVRLHCKRGQSRLPRMSLKMHKRLFSASHVRSVPGEGEYAFSITTDPKIPFHLSHPEFLRAGFQKEVECELTALERRSDQHVCPNGVARPLWLEKHVWGGSSGR